MPTILKTLLLLWHLWHFEVYAVELLEPTAPTSAYVNDSGVGFGDLRQAENAAATVEALIPPSTPLPKSTPDETTPTARQRRQLFYDPSLVLLTSFGSEGGKCITSRGTAGVCVRLSGCQSYYRYKRQLAYFALQQWAQSVSPVGQEICSFYDQFGRASSGICCTQTSTQDSGLGLLPAFLIPAAVNPIPPPPTTATPTVETDHATDNADNGEHDLDNATEVVSAATILPDSLQTSSPEFQDENNVIYDTVRDDADEKLQPQQPTAVSTYDDFLYQWPTQFASHFGTGIHQWPPPLPTHPPSAANWPPPIPTHPPNHHYPTHPAAAVKPTSAPTTTITTRRPTTTTSTTRRTFTTTTRRPSYPSYPGYPGFPSYPTYRPPTHATTTTTTRRPPAASQPDSSTPNGLPQQCGVKNRVSPDQERIVGGSNASPHEFPWIAVLFKAGKQFCGGSLITQNHILTAAHCVARMTSWDVAALTAHLGDYNIRTDFEVKHVVRRIKRLVRHKGFDFSTLHNDIAILTVNEPVKFSYEIQPICLPTSSAQQGRSYSGQLATVAGWGSLRENGPQPSILQKVQIPIWTNGECARKYGRAAPGGIIDSMICAGQVSKDSCSGDSGGPMIVSEDGRYTQVGIVSWGIGCGKGEYPGVYTRVTSLLSWIYKNIK